MIKVTIEIPGKETQIFEGEGIVFAITDNENIKRGIVGTFNPISLLCCRMAIHKEIDEGFSQIRELKRSKNLERSQNDSSMNESL